MPDENSMQSLPSTGPSGSPVNAQPSRTMQGEEMQGPMLVLAPPPTPPIAQRKRAEEKGTGAEISQSPFSVLVGHVYDGPLDLLLDLIRKQNIDIYDIPIAQLTAQFLEYTHHLQQTDVDAAGEFIYTASLLIHIKSRLLLPREPSDALTGADPEDPRRELVERLLEHERFKAAAQMLLQKQQIEDATWTHPGMPHFLHELRASAEEGPTGVEQEIAADTIDLVRVFQTVLERLRTRPVLNVDEEAVTVAQMIDFTKRRLLLEDHPLSLKKLLHNSHTQRAVICMFLALLELVRLQAVLLYQPELGGDLLIKKAQGFDSIFEEDSKPRDDWR